MSNQVQPENQELNTAFVLRLLWDNVAQSWRVVLKPADGGPKRVFVDLESAFLYVAQLYTV